MILSVALKAAVNADTLTVAVEHPHGCFPPIPHLHPL